jgi:hypothetical protein
MHMPIKEFMRKSQIDPSDTVEFYHISRDVSFMKSFLNDGAKAIGKGAGGQKTGFYVWPTRKLADKHINYLDDESAKEGGLLVGVRIPRALIQYPDWQIDYEADECLTPLFAKYHDDILNLKNFPISDGDKTEQYSVSRAMPYVPVGAGYCCEPLSFGFELRVKTEGAAGVEQTGRLQGICDALCQRNENFRKDYNQLLQERIALGKTALKYTGEKPLQISHLSLIQGDQKGKFEETVLYTDQKPKEKQVCPFVTAGLKIKASQKQ